MKLRFLFILCCSQPLLAQELSCLLRGTIVQNSEYQIPTNVYTGLKNDGYPVTAFGFHVSDSKARGNKKDDRKYCSSMNNKTLTVILSGAYPDDHFHTDQSLSISHAHQDKDVWPWWPNRYYVTLA
jgi:hypothetical protein